MAKTTYYSKKYQQAQQTRQTAAVKPAAAPAARRGPRTGPVLLVLGLLLGLSAVLLAPLVADGAAQPASASARPAAQSAAEGVVSTYENPENAMAALGIRVALPAALPEGYALTACRVLNGGVMELVYTGAKTTLILRAAAGSEDLSGMDHDSYAYTATETVDGIVRGYTGVSEKKLLAAVWTKADVAYAVLASDGLDAALLKAFAEGVA